MNGPSSRELKSVERYILYWHADTGGEAMCLITFI